MAAGFAEFAEYAAGCRFRDCTHVHEPGCAVRRAVADGAIPRSRYVSYRKLLGGDGDDPRAADEGHRGEQQAARHARGPAAVRRQRRAGQGARAGGCLSRPPALCSPIPAPRPGRLGTSRGYLAGRHLALARFSLTKSQLTSLSKNVCT